MIHSFKPDPLGVARVFCPSSAWACFPLFNPRLAPWAEFLRRFAAALRISAESCSLCG
jgi:hypothetical protein